MFCLGETHTPFRSPVTSTMWPNRQASELEGRSNGANVPHEAIPLMLPLPLRPDSLEKSYPWISGRRPRI